MKNKTCFASAICVLIFFISFMFNGRHGIYFDFMSFVLVVSGILGAGILGSSLEHIKKTFQTIFRKENNISSKYYKQTINFILTISMHKKRHDRILYKYIEQSPNTYIRNGIEMISDGIGIKDIKRVMEIQMHSTYDQFVKMETILRRMAAYAPAFGVAGSIVGLIGMLINFGDTDKMLASIPIALITTLYGVVISNFFLYPAADKIREYADSNAMYMMLATEGVLSLAQSKSYPAIVAILNSMVPPGYEHDVIADAQSARRAYIQSLAAR